MVALSKWYWNTHLATIQELNLQIAMVHCYKDRARVDKAEYVTAVDETLFWLSFRAFQTTDVVIELFGGYWTVVWLLN